MNKITIIVFCLSLLSCSSKHLKKTFKAKPELVDISNERSFTELTPAIKKQARKLKKRGYKIKKKDDGYFAIKGRRQYLLIDGYQCREFK